jgi:GNAT superfamily N-acetyltransferase
MKSKQITIECVKVKELYSYTCNLLDSLKPDEIMPISKHRALAWSNNPYADGEDYSLVVGWSEGQCVGYVGMFPGILRLHNRDEKIYWLSTWYVSPKFRRSGMAVKLLRRVFELGYDLCVTYFSGEVKKITEKMGRYMGPLQYWSGDITCLNPLALPLRKIRHIVRSLRLPGTAWLERLIKVTKEPGKNLLYVCLMVATCRRRLQISTRRVKQIKDFSFEIDQNSSFPVRFFRGTAVINWMLNNPWVVTDPSEQTPGYWFVDYHNIFEFIALEIYGRRDGAYRGFVVMRVDTVSHIRNLTVFDFHFKNPAYQRYLIPLAIQQARIFRVDQINLPEESQPDLEGPKLIRRLFRSAERGYLCRPKDDQSPLNQALGEIKLSLADGDTPFA